MPKRAAVARVLIAIVIVTLSSAALGVGADQLSGVQGTSAPVGARLAPPDPAADGADPRGPLFADVAPSGRVSALHSGALRSRFVGVNADLLARASGAQVVTLNLFKDVSYDAVLGRAEPE